MIHLLLLRHGEAIHNLEGRWGGWAAAPLTDEGHRQARLLAERLALELPTISSLYTSPLLRARQTAELIAHQLQLAPIVCDGLQEIDFGQVSGLTVETFRQTMPQVYARWLDRGDLAFEFPGGEQRKAFFQRVGRAVDRIVGQHSDGEVAVVAHGGTIRAALAHLFPDAMADWWAYSLDTASLTRVCIEKGANALVALNDCQHLQGGPD